MATPVVVRSQTRDNKKGLLEMVVARDEETGRERKEGRRSPGAEYS